MSKIVTEMRRRSAVSLLGLTLMALAMGGECMSGTMPPTTTPPANVSFANQIQAIFNANCIVCHATGGIADAIMHLNTGESFAALVNQPSVQNANLTRVVPGNSAGSLLFQKISSNSPPVGARMPLGMAPLSQSDIDLITNWINQGALNN